MAASDAVEGETKPKKAWLKWLVIVVVALVVLAGTVGATLFFSGFFSHKAAQSAEAALEEAQRGGKEGEGAGHGAAAGPAGAASKPERVRKSAPELTRFEYSYKQMDKELLSNLAGTRKVMQIQVAFMTSYDDRVFKNVDKHEFAIRSALLDVMRQYTEADVNRPEFRKELADRLRDEANRVLTQYEDFGGIDAIHFTTFIVQ